MNKRHAKLGEIWLVAMPILFVKGNDNYDTGFQIRPFLIVDEGKGMLIIENSDYLALKITTKDNKVKDVVLIDNWKELGLKSKSYIRIEIPQRIEKNQLIGKVSEMPIDQFLKYYKAMIGIFNVDVMDKILKYKENYAINK